MKKRKNSPQIVEIEIQITNAHPKLLKRPPRHVVQLRIGYLQGNVLLRRKTVLQDVYDIGEGRHFLAGDDDRR